jgi:8-oxo-dGTP pyrophosphatase MutT (NUDIX family)
VSSNVLSRRLGKRNSSARVVGSDERQQVAAVCYRVGEQGLEFLLVQTRGGRWIFPKGGVEPGLTQAQSAALEAFEEAGVHGRIEEMPFARYRLDKTSRGPIRGQAVTAHLCEVSHLEQPQEANRNPTWFSAQKAKRRLLEDRTAELGDELAGVVDRAVARIQRLQTTNGSESRKDALQKVRFEAFEDLGRDAALMRYLLLEQRLRSGSGFEGLHRLGEAGLRAANRSESGSRKILAFSSVAQLQLGAGVAHHHTGKKNHSR